MDTTDKQKEKPPQKPKRLLIPHGSASITVISFALSVVMSYISNEALGSAGNDSVLCGAAALHCARHCV